MAATKSKLASPHVAKWTNQVVRTSDGRLIVRGVDVPASGATWERVYSGKALPPATKSAPASSGRVLTAVTSKSKALATAKRAGLVLPSKTGSGKK